MYELILVSQSPRRSQILKDAGFLFRVGSVKISEIIEENVNLTEAISRIARAKAQAYFDSNKHLKLQKILLLSADTLVCMGERAYGKPENSTEAQVFLQTLSGQKHEVITGLCVMNLFSSEVLTVSASTEVEFRELKKDEIEEYVASGEPNDKAGAYAIQGHGQKFVKSIKGSYLNVVGLPIELFENILKQKGWDVARREYSKN